MNKTIKCQENHVIFAVVVEGGGWRVEGGEAEVSMVEACMHTEPTTVVKIKGATRHRNSV